jgi:ATP-binding cassette subfamily F protein 3
VFQGGFRDYVASLAPGRSDEQPPRDPRGRARKSEQPPPPKPPEEKRISFETDRAKKREDERRKRRIAQLEDLIGASEKELARMRAELRDHPGGDWTQLTTMASREQELAAKMETMMAEWTKLSEVQ